MEREGFLRLANAVIIQAVRDAQSGHISYNDFCRFVRSDYFLVLSRGSISPDLLIKELYLCGNGGIEHA